LEGLIVRFRQGVGDLVRHVARSDQWQRSFGGHKVFEVLPRHVFHHEVMHARYMDGGTGGLTDVEGGDDIRVLQSGHGADLAGEPLESPRILIEGCMKHFDGDGPAQADVFGFEDRTHAAGTQVVKDAIVAKNQPKAPAAI
jgi:hypothetical protein